MSDPTDLPIRVLVKGASTVVWTSWMGGPRTDLAFPRVIEQQLRAAGHQAEVRTTAVAAQRTKTALEDWELEVGAWSPDVVILHYGHYETIHLFLPWWLERHANSLRAVPGPLRNRYRKVVRKVWVFLAKVQNRVDRTIDPTIRRHRPRAVAATLARLIGHIRGVASPLVLVFETLPPSATYQQWFPGMERRIEVMNDSIRTMVEELADPDIRMFDIVELATSVTDDPTPDGAHYTPEVHRAIGEAIADVIVTWASDKEHLIGERT